MTNQIFEDDTWPIRPCHQENMRKVVQSLCKVGGSAVGGVLLAKCKKFNNLICIFIKICGDNCIIMCIGAVVVYIRWQLSGICTSVRESRCFTLSFLQETPKIVDYYHDSTGDISDLRELQRL